MKYATEASMPDGVVIGTKRLHYQVKERTDFLAIAEDEDSVRGLIARSFGDQAAARSFVFEVDEFHKWFQRVDLNRGGSQFQGAIDTITLLQKRLGSIAVTGAAFTFAGNTLRSFWIESREDLRVRVLTGQRTSGAAPLYPFPADWQFDPPALAQAIVSQY